jgi:hypothetical protein
MEIKKKNLNTIQVEDKSYTEFFFRVLSHPDFSSDFHLFGLEWSPTGFEFSVDNVLIGSMSPPPGGFWEMGGFEGENIWNLTGNGTRIAPFDHPVISVGLNFYLIL